MPEWIVPMEVLKKGAEAYVQADTEKEAIRKAKAGEWDRIEDIAAEIADWDVYGKPQRNE